ncbi:MAG: hypothetical protein H6R26_2253 [Proteobacteria bacterium]|nr:hypothetical protein [Pseudomonadota bacterium]
MIDWIICGILLVWISSLAILVLAARRAMAHSPASASDASDSRVAVFVPVTGMSKAVESSIRSLLDQTPRSVEVIFALRDPSDPGSVAVRSEIESNESVKCVFAGPATACGQKNQNLLAGIAAVSSNVEIFVFADAGHGFPPGWLDLLVGPIACGEAEVTSGYHAIRPADGGFLPWVYAVCVEMMHVFQNAPGLSQPWGGAMAISRATFDRLKVSDTWRASIVDDVSLAKVLKIHGVKVRMVPLVRRETTVSGLHLRELFEWMVRQLQYVRFIFPGTWAFVGAWSIVQVLAFATAGWLVVVSLFDGSVAPSTAASALYLLLMGVVLLEIRLIHPLPCTPIRWLAAGALFLLVFGAANGTAGIRRQIQWRGITYHVGRGGRVLSIRRQL